MKKDEFNIVMAGVGGQGIILVGRILSTAILKSGYHLYYAETHGMARRGGAVVSKLRFGNGIHTPNMLGSTADIVVGFEPLEALRHIHFLNPKGMIIVNTRKIMPALASKEGGKGYPSVSEIEEFISKRFDRRILFDATAMAEKTGNPLTMSVLLLGAMSATGILPIKEDLINDSMSEHIREDMMDVNRNAFELGYRYVKEILEK
jgi:indolepyruvate ferredoxin oxidoreductase beta subunit